MITSWFFPLQTFPIATFVQVLFTFVYLLNLPFNCSSYICFLNKSWGEIQRSFIQEFYYELGAEFTPVDDNNNMTNVKFNQHPDNPLLTDGWDRVRHVFRIEGDRLMLLT